jgi:hypothetical protein
MSDHEDLHEIEVCPNDECYQPEPEYGPDGCCKTCGEYNPDRDPNYDGPPDGAWPGSIDPDEQRHQMEQARRLRR